MNDNKTNTNSEGTLSFKAYTQDQVDLMIKDAYMAGVKDAFGCNEEFSAEETFQKYLKEKK